MSILACSLLGVWGAGAVQELSAPHAEIYREAVVGIALYPDGETPVAKLPVRLWDVNAERFVYRSRTEADGTFHIPDVRVGRYYLFVSRVRVDLKVIESEDETGAQQHDVVVIVPRRFLFARHPNIWDTPWLVQGLAVREALRTPPARHRRRLPKPPPVVSP